MVGQCFSLSPHMELSGTKDARRRKSTNIQLPLKALAYNSVPPSSIFTATKTHRSFHLSQSQRALLVTHVSPRPTHHQQLVSGPSKQSRQPRLPVIAAISHAFTEWRRARKIWREESKIACFYEDGSYLSWAVKYI